MLAMFEEELARIDRELPATPSHDIPELFRRLPLENFASLLLAVPEPFPNLRRWLPAMPPDQVQDSWTGTHGEALMAQSVAFIKTMLQGYPEISGRPIRDAIVLDYGCGWGRLIRLLYKFVPVEQIYGVDPWDQSIALCREYGVRGNLAVSDWVPQRLPFDQPFDLIFAFSVFTHLSEKTTRIVMSTLRRYIRPHGVLLITIRPREYWHVHEGGALWDPMSRAHDSVGFAFTPHNRPPVDGDITYGDTSMTLAYIEKSFPQWRVHSLECNRVDPFQVLVFLTPA